MYNSPMNPQGHYGQGQQGHQGQGHQGHQGHHGSHVVYQAEPNWQHTMKHKRDAIMHALHPHMGHKVRVTTIDGHTHEGVLINADGHHVYLNMDHGHHRPIYTPAQYNQILTLVLFELLVIVLLS